jgi:hypothetical protein
MKMVLHRRNVVVMAVLTSIVVGCATQLAPLYDKALVDGITAVNTDVMTLFASMAGGSVKGTYQERSDKYDKAIGTVDALAIQSAARPVPTNRGSEAANKWLEKRHVPPLTEGEIPSAIALREISKTIQKMRETDQKQGVTATEVSAFKNQVVIYMDQAVTYEAFLQR